MTTTFAPQDSLGHILKQAYEAQTRYGSQQELALDWLEECDPEMSTDTPPSRLSELFHDKERGINFFFKHDKRAHALLKRLGFEKQEERTELIERARATLAGEHQRPPRLILDVLSWGSDAGVLGRGFKLLAELFMEHKELTPLGLLLTDEQHNQLPRSWDKEDGSITTCIVKDQEQGRTQILEWAKQGATLVSSQYQLLPYEQWVAMHLDQKELTLDPPDAITVLKESGVLPSLPQVEYPLSELAPEIELDKLEVKLSNHSVAIRRAMKNLVLGQYQDTIEKRLKLAQLLGVTASSTQKERDEVKLQELIAQLELPVQSKTEQDLVTLLNTVHHVELEAQLWRVKDSLHLINAQDKTLEHPFIVRHTIAWTPTPAQRLQEAFADYTEQDVEQDRCLEKLILQLDPEQKETAAFINAQERFLQQRPQPKALEPCKDWLSLLQSMLDSPRLPELGYYIEKSEYFTGNDIQRGWRKVLPSKLFVPSSRGTQLLKLQHRHYGNPYYEPHGSIQPDEFNAQAHHHLTYIWLALRRALRHPSYVETADGEVNLLLEAGLIAKLSLQSLRPSQAPPQAFFLLTGKTHYWNLKRSLLYHQRTQALAQTYEGTSSQERTIQLPQALILEGAGLRVTLDFDLYPFSDSPSWTHINRD